MKTQISRIAYDPDKRYSGVYQQQGRMLTDADWNALADIVKERLDEALADVIGSGSPRGESGFHVANPDPQKEPGASGPVFRGRHLYAEGVPAEVVPAHAGIFNYVNQADFPSPPLPVPSPAFTFYADVWERTVDALEDTGSWAADHLLDPALHGADTTTRTQTMAQIKWSPKLLSIDDLNAIPRIGNALLTVTLRSSQTGIDDPCDPCARDLKLTPRTGNYLFRVEIHDVVGTPSAPKQVTLKWSSENGAERHRVAPLDTVPEDFKKGAYVYEFYNDDSEKHLGVHLPEFTPTRLKLYDSYPTPPTPLPAGFDRVRRWDGYAVLNRSAKGVWSLASGRDRETAFRTSVNGKDPGNFHFVDPDLVFHLQALDLTLTTLRDPQDEPPPFRFFVAGDYWLAPVRESAHKAGAKVLDKALPIGIRHHYLRLTDIDASGKVRDPDKYREQHLNFPPLTDIKASDVDYGPACDATGRLFETKVVGQPVDTVKAALDRLCDIGAQHIAFTEKCSTSLYQGVKIATVADALHLLCDIRARHVGFDPPDKCDLLLGSKTVQEALSRICAIKAENVGYTGCPDLKPNIKTVKEALDALCARPSGGGGGGGCRVTVGEGGAFPTLAQAVNTLLNSGKTDLSLCLLPGDHLLDEPLNIDGKNKALQLALCGCGRGSRLTLSAKGLLNFQNVRSLRIEQLMLRLDPPAQLLAQGGFEVTLEGVVMTGTSSRPPGTPAPVFLQATLSVRVATSRLQFPADEGQVVVGYFFTPVYPPLGDLFTSRLDDEKFAPQKLIVADGLIALKPTPRMKLVRDLTTFLQQSAPLGDSLQRSLERLSTVITPQFPDRAAVIGCLDDLRAVGQRSVPSLALVLAPAGGDVTLVDNQILGVVSVYGVSEADSLTSDQLRALTPGLRPDSSGRVPIELVPTAGRLSIDRNELTRLVIGGPPLARLRELAVKAPLGSKVEGIYRAAYLAQNRFTVGGNRVLAKDVRLTDNFFEPVDADLGAAIADTANYVGNGAVENDAFRFFNITRRHNAQTLLDQNTMKIV